MTWMHILALTLWLLAVVMLAVVPIEYRRQAGFGESGNEVVARVIAHGEGVLANANDDALQIGIQVEYIDGQNVAHQRWLYGMRAVPPVGEDLTLVHPSGSPQLAGLPISASTRWWSALSLVALATGCALLGGVVWIGAAAGAAPWLRFAPALFLCGLLTLVGVSAWRLARSESALIDARYARTAGEVVANEACGTRSLGGGRSTPLFCAVLRYEAAGQTWQTRTVGMLTPAPPGTQWVVRYSTSRPDLALVERDRTFESQALAGMVMLVLGVVGALAAAWAWFRAVG
jgi:hypothetical protein